MPAKPNPAPPAPLSPSSLTRLAGRRILIAGDILLDRYVWGDAERISPEAPVPVVRQGRVTEVPGGALNVARNVTAAGGRAAMIGVIGRDDEGASIKALMKNMKMEIGGLVADATRPTSLKTRVLCAGQQLVRIDREVTGPCGEETAKAILQALEARAGECDAIILSDYRKGVVTPALVREAARLARKHGIPLVADPKQKDFRFYEGADWLTPNLKEATEAAGEPLHGEAEVERAGRKLAKLYKGRGIVITRGHEGLSVIPVKGAVEHERAQAREVFDVTGAGDTFIAHFALGLAAGFDPADAARIGNAAAGIAVGKIGAVTVSPGELAEAFETAAAGAGRGLSKVRSADDLRLAVDHLRALGRRIVFTNGCFDLFHAGHVGLLHRARALGDTLIVALNTDRSVRRLKGAPRPILPEGQRSAVLAALGVVDFIVFFDEDTPEGLLRALRPDVLVKGEHDGADIVGADIVRAYGGEVVALPFEAGPSTADILRTLRSK